MSEHKIYSMPVAEVYPHYVTKVERKGRTVAGLHEVITWLTGYSEAQLKDALDNRISFREFFAQAQLNPNAELITGSICGVKIQEIEDPLMKQIQFLDKVVDELAKGKAMEKIKRG